MTEQRLESSLLMKAAHSAAEADGLRPVKKENNSQDDGNGGDKAALAMAAAQAQLVAQQRQQQQQQQRKSGSSSSSKKKGQQLRRGKWTPEEESYANRLIQEFKAGLLPLTDGTTLRTFLSKLLNCDPMRISKKFVGSNCIGKQVFRRRTADLNRLTPEQIQKSRAELSELERRFLERVAQTNRVKNSSVGGGGGHQNNHMHNQNIHNQHRQHMGGGGVSHQHHNAVVSAALSAAAAANVPMHHSNVMNGGNGNYMNGNRNNMNGMHQNPPWMQPPMGYKQGFGAQMARDNLSSGSGNSRTAAAGRALLEGLGGGGGRMGNNNNNNSNNKNGNNDGGNGMSQMAMAELQRRASMQMQFGNQSAQNLLAALSSGNSNQSLVQMARNASVASMGGGNGGANSFNNLMMKSGFSRDQLSQLARDSGLSSASLSNPLDGRKNSFDQLMSLDFQSLQSIDNLANLIQTGGVPGRQAPSNGIKNWSADQNSNGHMNNHNGNRLSSTASLSNAARRLASQNNFESLMRNISSNNNLSRTGLNNDDFGNGGGNTTNGNNNNNGQSSSANLQSLFQSMSNNGGNISMSSLLNGNNASAASLANLLRADNSSTGLSALRNSDGLSGRNTTSVEDFLSLMATGDIPHQDPAVLNLPLSHLQQHQQQTNNSNGNISNNNNNGDHRHGMDGGDGGANMNNSNMGDSNNSDAAANILAQATGNPALANAMASRSFGSNLGSFADMSRAAGSNLSSQGSTLELLQQLADAGSSNSLNSMKRKLLDVDGSMDTQGMNKR